MASASIIVTVCSLSSHATAADCTAPCIGYTVTGELQDDFLFSPEALSGGTNDLSPSVNADLFFAPIEGFRLVTELTNEPVIDRPPGELPRFTDVGLHALQLYAEIDVESIKARVGKIEPVFSLASSELNGLHATDLVDGYELLERLGGEAAVRFEALGLSQSLTASIFTVDRTLLSDSLFRSRGQTGFAGGGAGNTDGLSSFAIALDGCSGAETADCTADGDFGYRLAFRHQGAGVATADQIEEGITPGSEQGLLAAATARFDISDAATLRLLGEAGYLRNFEGGTDDAAVGTVSASLESGPLTYAATYSLQQNLVANGPDTLEHLIDLSVEYTLSDEASFAGETWSLGAGYAYAVDADGQNSHAIGARLTIELDGSYGWGGSQDEAAEPPSQNATEDEATAADEPAGNEEE